MDTGFLRSLNASRPSAGSAKLPLSMQNTITAALGHRYAKYLKRLWISKSAICCKPLNLLNIRHIRAPQPLAIVASPPLFLARCSVLTG
jgi:hypothetical protein